MAQLIITIAECITAGATILGALFFAYRWYLKQKRHEQEIKELKGELCIITYEQLACLKGLGEQGCNGPVTEATNMLEKHINKKAHDQE